MTNYELLYIVNPQFTEIEAEKIKEEINELVKKNEGQIGYQEAMGKRKLAYPISHAAHGYYYICEFEAEDSQKVKIIVNALKLDKKILRAQIITKPKKTAEEIAVQARRKTNAAEETETEIQEKEVAKKPVREKKLSMENLDEKLDEILEDDNVV